ncbi:MAG: ABC transporter substrate-binding protein [Planctomycetaceae bacterium]|nr:ABC transporter substrate-binding protein [Planctomycetaceae bacterium]
MRSNGRAWMVEKGRAGSQSNGRLSAMVSLPTVVLCPMKWWTLTQNAISTGILMLILLLSGTLLPGCGGTGSSSGDTGRDASAAESAELVLALNWYAEAEHGGYVAAKELGFFKDEGLRVSIQPGGPGAPNLVIQELAAGRIPFAVSSADMLILARSQGVPVVAVAAPLQQSPRCIMVHKASGIEKLEQLQNVELAISEARPFALWMKKKLPLTNVTMVPYSGMVGEFLQKPNFAQQGYVFSEPFVARESGGDPVALMVSETGFNPYESMLVTSESMIAQQPDVVRKVVEASVRGWESYLQNPEPVNQRIHAQNADMTLPALSFGAAAMQPLCETKDGLGLCEMQKDRWKLLIEQIEELGEIPVGTVKADECFTNEFLPAAESPDQSTVE